MAEVVTDRLGKIFILAFGVSVVAISVAALIPGEDSSIELVAHGFGIAATAVMLSFILLTLALLIWDGIAALIKRR